MNLSFLFWFLSIIQIQIFKSFGLSEFKTIDLNNGEKIKKILNINESSTYLFTNNVLYSIDENNNLKTISSFNLLTNDYSDIYTFSNESFFLSCSNNNLLSLVNSKGEIINSISYNVNDVNLKIPNIPCSLNYNSNNNIILLSYSYYNSTEETMDYYILKFLFNKETNSIEYLDRLNIIQNEISLSEGDLLELLWSYLSCEFFDDENIFCVHKANDKRLKYLLLSLSNLQIKEKDYLSSTSMTDFVLIKLSNKLISVCGGGDSNYIILGIFFDIEKKIISYISNPAIGYLMSYSIKTLSFSKSDNHHIYTMINYGIPIIFRYGFSPDPVEMGKGEVEIEISFDCDSYNLISINQNNFKIIVSHENNHKVYISSLSLPKQLPLFYDSYEVHLKSNEETTIKLEELIDFSKLTESQLQTLDLINKVYYGETTYTKSTYTLQYKAPSNGNYHFDFSYTEEDFYADSFIIPVKVCYPSCGSCDSYSENASNMSCINCDSNYFPLYNNRSQCYISTELIDYYYYNSTNQIFQKCYDKCKRCAGDATEESNMCISCIENYYLVISNHSCIECDINVNKWYNDIDNDIKICLIDNDCPENYPKLLNDTNECAIKCPDNNYTESENNICINIKSSENSTSNETGGDNTNNTNNNDTNPDNTNNNNSENVVRNAESNVIDYYNRQLVVSQDNFELRVLKIVSPEISNEKIDSFGNIISGSYINLLDDNYNKITSTINSSSFYILQINVKNSNGLTDQIEYSFYDLEGEKINIENILDKNSYIKISSTLKDKNKLIAESIYEKNNNYDALNSSNKFYYDVCSKFTDSNGNDVTIEDRRKYFYDSNLKFCESNYCSFLSYDYNKRIVDCQCKIKTQINLKENEFDSLYPQFENNNSYSNENFRILKCTKETKQKLSKNPGFWISLILFLLESVFIFLSFKNNLIQKHYSHQNEIEISNPPKNSNENVESEIEEKNKNEKEIEKKNTLVSDSETNNSKKKLNSENELMKKTNTEYENLETPSEKENENKVNKSCLDIYISLIHESQIILFTFVNKDYYNKSIKISMFIFTIAIILLLNIFFQFNKRISHIFKRNSNDYDFFYSFPYLICIIIVTNIINCILKHVFLYKNNDKLNEKNNNNRTFKLILLSIIQIFFIIFLWCHISFFCGIFVGTKKHLFLDAFFSFIILNLFSFISCILYSVLMVQGVKNNNKKLCKLCNFLSKF